ncbi:MAG: hypothetical protein KF727_14205 [Microbacteriaceae bacterium]|nr:hypothetical protein [Microbacteriaceae bacterium]
MIVTRPKRRGHGSPPSVLLQARVAPESHALVREAAERSGVSMAYYVEALVQQIVDERGALPEVPNPRPQREELPINAA